MRSHVTPFNHSLFVTGTVCLNIFGLTLIIFGIFDHFSFYNILYICFIYLFILLIYLFYLDFFYDHHYWGTGGVKGPALVLFLFYVNVSGMRPRSRLSSQPLTTPAAGFSSMSDGLSPGSTLRD